MTPHPLPSWNDGHVKSAILDFVARITRGSGPDHVPSSERIAVFDNDGTLWCEQPLQTQFYFGRDRLQELAEKDSSLKKRQPYKAFLEHDIKTIMRLGKKGFFQVAAFAHAGVTVDEFGEIARRWLATARNPKLHQRFVDLVYWPQIELLEFLRANDFKTYVVSGGGIDLIRSFSEERYGIPPEQVIGSSVKTRFDVQNNRGELMKLAELNSFDDRETKVENIGLHIGRRPILSFGNSDGDLAMLRYTKAGSGLRLALLVHHDDAGREFAYDRDFKLSPLSEGLDNAAEYGIALVSMKNDWKTVFSPNAEPARVRRLA